jgi:hypothetical protein
MKCHKYNYAFSIPYILLLLVSLHSERSKFLLSARWNDNFTSVKIFVYLAKTVDISAL